MVYRILLSMKLKILIISLIICSCRPRYEVIQEVDQHVYHLQGVANKDVLIILSDVTLEPGQIIRPKKEDLYENVKENK